MRESRINKDIAANSALVAKAQTIQVWKYLAAHGEIRSHAELPSGLRSMVDLNLFACSLVEFGNNKTCSRPSGFTSALTRWRSAWGNNARRSAAQRVLDVVKAWEI